jgi:acetyltransferase-like isoleucine patch superfamily enzyme
MTHPTGGTTAQLRLYLARQADSGPRYALEQLVQLLAGWMPTILGIGVRGVLYRLILRMDGWAAIERGVRLRFANHIRLGHGTYLDEGVYIHACPGGVRIGDGTLVMHGAVLHVYNFRDLPHAGICIGRNSLISEYTVIRGQGGVSIGDRVYTSPMTQIVAVNHIFDDAARPFVEQGITAEGIVIEDDVWLGAGAVVTDGVASAAAPWSPRAPSSPPTCRRPPSSPGYRRGSSATWARTMQSFKGSRVQELALGTDRRWTAPSPSPSSSRPSMKSRGFCQFCSACCRCGRSWRRRASTDPR